MVGSDTLIVKIGKLHEVHVCSIGMGMMISDEKTYGEQIVACLAKWGKPDGTVQEHEVAQIRNGTHNFSGDFVFLWDTDQKKLFDKDGIDVTDKRSPNPFIKTH
jgi:hypothetical protein